MKNKYILIASLLSLIIISIFLINGIMVAREKNRISKIIVDFINDKVDSEYLNEDAYNDLMYAMSDDVNHYDVSDFVKDYIEIINKCLDAKSNGKKVEYYSQYNYVANTTSKITIHSLKHSNVSYISKLITDEDIDNYKKDIFNDVLKEKLGKVFEYKGENKWFISGNEDRTIELPYNVYVNYVSNKKQNKNKFKKIVSIKINDPIDKKYVENDKTINCTIKYEDLDGNIVSDNGSITIIYDMNNNLKVDLYYLLRKFYSNANRPELTAGQHDYDEEERRIREEEATLVNEYGKITPPNVYEREQSKKVVNSEILEVPEFIKYKAEAVVVINTYDDGSIDYRFRASKITDSLGSSSNKNYILKYTDIKDIEDLLKKYLADKKNFKNDENWLKKGNYYYNEK